MVFAPQNALEESLERLRRGLCPRAQFLRAVIAADLLAIRYGRPSGQPAAGPGSALPLTFTFQDGMACIPVFTSRLRLDTYTQGPTESYTLPGREFLRLSRGADLILNPGAEASVILSAHEIALALDQEP